MMEKEVDTLKILLVEDEKALASAVAEVLRHEKYSVDTVFDGSDGLDYGLTGLYDLVILDVMLPEMDGFTVLEGYRKGGISTPVLMLTARSQVEDKIKGLDLGADDYLAKPFDMGELLARVRAMGRRRQEFVGDVVRQGGLSLDRNTGELCYKEDRVKLGTKEYQVMELFFANPKQVITKELFIEKIWGYDCEAEYNSVEVYISFLRKKLAYLHSDVTVKTIRGRGYLLEETA